MFFFIPSFQQINCMWNEKCSIRKVPRFCQKMDFRIMSLIAWKTFTIYKIVYLITHCVVGNKGLYIMYQFLPFCTYHCVKMKMLYLSHGTRHEKIQYTLGKSEDKSNIMQSIRLKKEMFISVNCKDWIIPIPIHLTRRGNTRNRLPQNFLPLPCLPWNSLPSQLLTSKLPTNA